ncbi:MAG: hypothetical protein R3D60_06565 [Paracoccaceae bacterium]
MKHLVAIMAVAALSACAQGALHSAENAAATRIATPAPNLLFGDDQRISSLAEAESLARHLSRNYMDGADGLNIGQDASVALMLLAAGTAASPGAATQTVARTATVGATTGFLTGRYLSQDRIRRIYTATSQSSCLASQIHFARYTILPSPDDATNPLLIEAAALAINHVVLSAHSDATLAAPSWETITNVFRTGAEERENAGRSAVAQRSRERVNADIAEYRAFAGYLNQCLAQTPNSNSPVPGNGGT